MGDIPSGSRPVFTTALRPLLGLLFLLAPCQIAAAANKHYEPFYLGVTVEADPAKTGQLPGEPRFNIEGICQDLAKIKANAVWVKGFDGRNAGLPQMGRWLECAHSLGMKVVLEGSGRNYSIEKGVSVAEQQIYLKGEVIPIWKEIAKRFGRHFGLLAYVPVEAIDDNAEEGAEPTIEALDQLAEAVNRVDPAHPVVTNHKARSVSVAETEARIRRRAMSVEAAQLYPFTYAHDWNDSTTAWNAIEAATQGMVDLTLKHAAIAQSIGARVWITGQAFGSVWTKKWVEERKNQWLPSEDEMHLQVWSAIIAGANGFFAHTYASVPEPANSDKARLDEWETITGMRTLQGGPTSAYEGFESIAAVLSRHLELLGDLRANGDIMTLKPLVIGRRFWASNGRGYAVVLNQSLLSTVKLPQQTALGIFAAQNGLRIAPGHGVLFRAHDDGQWVAMTPCELL